MSIEYVDIDFMSYNINSFIVEVMSMNSYGRQTV